MSVNVSVNLQQQAQTNQPARGGRAANFRFQNEFSTGLFECCSDCGNCCYAYFCMPCFLCKVYEDAGECMCTPFLCGVETLPILRTKIRTAYKIDGAMWKDLCVVAWCGFC
ncbi:unnamed protein product, partial [Brachionus calyciflorus]